MPTKGYAHPELLAETEWLAQHLSDANIRIVDCEGPDAYGRAHILGAVCMGDNPFLKGQDGVHVMPPEEFAELMAGLGIGDDTLVVAYDGHYSRNAARLWWALNYYGHPKVKVLNGGWRKWLAEGRPATDRATTTPHRTSFTPRVTPSLLVTGEGVKNVIGKPENALWDVRSREEYTGENTRGNKYSGHVPGARHLEWLEMMDTEGLATFRPAEEIRRMLAEKGITPEKQAYTY